MAQPTGRVLGAIDVRHLRELRWPILRLLARPFAGRLELRRHTRHLPAAVRSLCRGAPARATIMDPAPTAPRIAGAITGPAGGDGTTARRGPGPHLTTQAPSHAPPGSRRRAAGRGRSPRRPNRPHGSATVAHGSTPLGTTVDRRPARIAVAVDDTTAAREALRMAVSLARRSGAMIVLLHVARPRWSSFDRGPAVMRTIAQSTTDGWALLARARHAVGPQIPCTAELLHGQPGQAIAHRAAELGAELLVVGGHRRGALERWLFGSTSDDILRRAPCPVVVVPATRTRRAGR